MTFRAIILGLGAAVVLAAIGYYNDHVIGLDPMTAGDLLPISVFGVLFVLVLVVNPLLYSVWGDRRLRPSELAVILVLMLVACSVASGGLIQTFTPSMMMPIYYYQELAGWQQVRLLEYTPKELLPGNGHFLLSASGVPEETSAAVRDFVHGIDGTQEQNLYSLLGKIPWGQWRDPLTVWMPMLILMAVAGTCMCLIVHRQWSKREHLRYPIAELANTLMAQDSHGRMGTIFRNKLFWIGLAVILAIRIINGTQAFFPNFIQVPLDVSFIGIRQKWPEMFQTRYGGWLFVPKLFPTVVAFSFFLSSEITLSLGLSQWILIPVASILITHGVDFQEGYITGGPNAWQRAGSYLAYALMILYLGRRYYWLLAKQAFSFRAHREVENHAAWAFRIGLAAAVVVTVMLAWHGLDWPIAIITVSLMLMTFLCIARITAETGMFMIHPRWQALGVLLGLFGAYSLGPQVIVVAGLACVVLSVDQGQTITPYLINGLKICDGAGVKPRRIGLPAILVFSVCAVVGVSAALCCDYREGIAVRQDTDYALWRVPTDSYHAAEKAIKDLSARAATDLTMKDGLEESRKLGPLERLVNLEPKREFLWAAGIGIALVLVVSALRQRLPWWPLHPVMFLLWGTNPMATFHHSFLLGWLVRSAVMKYAGHSAIRKSKPLMVGVIAGDLLGGALFIAIGAIYYKVTGHAPEAQFDVFRR